MAEGTRAPLGLSKLLRIRDDLEPMPLSQDVHGHLPRDVFHIRRGQRLRHPGVRHVPRVQPHRGGFLSLGTHVRSPTHDREGVALAARDSLRHPEEIEGAVAVPCSEAATPPQPRPPRGEGGFELEPETAPRLEEAWALRAQAKVLTPHDDGVLADLRSSPEHVLDHVGQADGLQGVSRHRDQALHTRRRSRERGCGEALTRG
mmetsp:Transcript_20598/g.61229  ORF Transcript_20598/g.61229 Transcript_20598/m.61229 type:complete len:203 (+) Transcript_20598:3331-3939(+)